MADDVHYNAQVPRDAAASGQNGLGDLASAGDAGERTTIIPPLNGTMPDQAPQIPVGAYPQDITNPGQAPQFAYNNAQVIADDTIAKQPVGVAQPAMVAAQPTETFAQPGNYGQPAASFQQPLNSQDLSSANWQVDTSEPVSHAARSRKPQLALIISLCVLAAVLVAILLGFFGARSYYQHRAAPGVSFAGESVAGKDAQELKDLVSAKVAASNFVINDSQGGRTKATLKDLGVTSDVDATVNQILSAKSSSDLVKINPFQHSSVPLSLSSDDVKMNEFLTAAFVDKDKQAVPSSINYDQASKKFVAQEGNQGRAPKLESVKAAISQTANEPGQGRTVKISYHDIDMPIKKDVAVQAADDANKRLATPMVITSDKSDDYTIPIDQVAQWIKPVSDLGKGQISLTYDKAAVKAYAAKELPANLNQDPVTEKNVKNSKGEVLIVTTKGVDGVKVKDTDSAANQIVDQLKSGQIAPIQAAADVEPHKVESRTARYDVPDGDMWVEVNLSTQTATAYKGTTEVKSFPICSGLPRDGDESDLGTFFINVRYAIQTMRGPGYVSPNVKWVSYYNGSEGFHTASWNYDAIAHGDAANRGSHGCINMYEQDAQWIYDNCPIGTMVKVVGEQPTHAVR
ncbi:peptidoglycan-binding protein [Bombiscardovia apis]|uniref:Peptidoglycan-binding protein n=1 Tax=Bombiscardovia apis TaxID=2932182 RepID=A0ABN6SDY5_9BIFI|nr:L,D-transpeptidase family protein [Bombiscardovia apis]BDR54252.1 peptidoglycan-binding protein [Bombiscardovia apis]